MSMEEAYETSERPGSYGGFMIFAKAYREWKSAYGYVDYNDMLERVLGKNIKFGGTHMVIDEAQDLSPLQWEVIDRLIELASPKEVHVCGDDDQALYRWAGADPHGMDKFESKYGASRHVLAQSWRVPRSVHEVANDVLCRISRRVPKEYTPRDAVGSVEKTFDFDSTRFTEGEDTMILGRTHSILRDVEESLRHKRVLFTKRGGRNGLYTNIYAQSIRAIAKVKDDRAISDIEYKSLLKAIKNSVVRGEVEAGDYSSLKKYRYQSLIDIPYHLSEYYNYVDVTKTPTVTLSTIHGAKGRESDRVVLLTKLTPRIQESLAGGAFSADDEHRVFYVGVTRAKQTLNIIQDYEGYDL
jgi:superfamily I DNA/RNA helicase